MAAGLVAAGRVAAGRVAAGRVAAGPVAAGRVAAGRVAARRVAKKKMERYFFVPQLVLECASLLRDLDGTTGCGAEAKVAATTWTRKTAAATARQKRRRNASGRVPELIRRRIHHEVLNLSEGRNGLNNDPKSQNTKEPVTMHRKKEPSGCRQPAISYTVQTKMHQNVLDQSEGLSRDGWRKK